MKVIYKKYMKYFILFLIIVTSLYLLFNKFITLENFSNNIVPINSDSEIVFQDITSSDYNYYFKTDVKDKMDQNIEVNDIKLSNPESSTTNTHKWVVPIGTNSDSSDHKCKYTYYTKNT